MLIGTSNVVQLIENNLITLRNILKRPDSNKWMMVKERRKRGRKGKACSFLLLTPTITLRLFSFLLFCGTRSDGRYTKCIQLILEWMRRNLNSGSICLVTYGYSVWKLSLCVLLKNTKNIQWIEVDINIECKCQNLKRD